MRMQLRISGLYLKQGFTLVELIVVFSIITIMGSVALTQYRALQMQAAPAHAAVVLAGALREAQQHALEQDYDTAWGVQVAASGITVFSGTTFATRTVSRDVTYYLPSSIAITGSTSIAFTKFTGLPSGAATTTFGNAYDTSTTTISTGGAIGYTP